ncbi:hypothetical protein CSOJ01_15499 [Colletotrichum sojae]|uniref:DUF6536 domain-containing protein n=1 Tax=Colletotrichum sojae TaxID=2175907 RepID=A0A8H6INC4_9PEZI|nr:hypothetical protein CSOJ01_15499 [Colletotrichum sojae]
MAARAPNSAQELNSVVAVFSHGYQALLSILSRDPYYFSPVTSPSSKSESSDTSPRWLPTGWRRPALVNVGLTSASLVILTSTLLYSISMKSNFNQVWAFYTSDCKSTATANTLLHLLINIVSTGLFASSNFFMQVLNSPSMQEIKFNHSRGKWLDIGIPSWRNAFHLHTFKLVAWIFLLLTSLPIHLLFNSSIFQINSRYGDFHLTIAAESFLQGGSYVLPGAALLVATPRGFGNGALRPTRQDILTKNAVYSAQLQNVSATAIQASKWSLLDASECQRIYKGNLCTGLQEYRNVVMVAEGDGWKRSETWDLSADGERLWDSTTSASELNSLWYDAQCTMTGELFDNTPICQTDCAGVLRSSESMQPEVSVTRPYILRVQEWHETSTYSNSSPHSTHRIISNKPFEISHCLAEKRETTCSVALSRPLLLAVVLSVFSKLVISVSVVWIMGADEPLVTLGDAVASFIRDQDEPLIPGYPTDAFVRQNAKHICSGIETYHSPEREIWRQRKQRRANAVPTSSWVRNCWFWIITVVPIATLLALQVNNSLLLYLEMSREWDQFSTAFCSLRVTQPNISLMTFTSIIHWLLSSSLYTVVSKGSYYQIRSYYQTRDYYRPQGGSYSTDTFSLPEDATVTLCVSYLPILIQLVLCITMVLFLQELSKRELPGYMPLVGSNSLAISAACRVSPLSKAPRRSTTEEETQDIELEECTPRSTGDPEVGGTADYQQDVVLYPLKWGEVKMPEDWYLQADAPEETDRVGHLGFGTVEDDPQPPTNGRRYR